MGGGGEQGRSRLPGPTDTRLVGMLTAEDASVVREILDDPATGGDFDAVSPENIPVEIAKALPEGAQWVESRDFNQEVTGPLYEGRFYVDRKSHRVLFDCSNPVSQDPPPNVVVG